MNLKRDDQTNKQVTEECMQYMSPLIQNAGTGHLPWDWKGKVGAGKAGSSGE